MKRAWVGITVLSFVALLGAPLFAQSQGDTSGGAPAIPENPDSLFGPAATEGGGQSPAAEGNTPSAAGGNASQQTAPSPQASGSTSSGAGSSTPESPDQLFQGGMVQSAQQTQAPTGSGAAEGFLKSTATEWGGYLYSEYTGTVSWGADNVNLGNVWENEQDYLVPDLEGDLYFDSRPFDYFRVFGKLKMTYPFQDTETLDYLAPPAAKPSTETANITIPNLSIFELYSDFSYKDAIYFRTGKQVVNWGVGYFFSPADVISITPIDPQNPTLEREGPVALKANMPFANVDNLYLYVIANQAFAEDNVFHVDDLALAPKVEFVVGDYEIGLGGYYQRSRAQPRPSPRPSPIRSPRPTRRLPTSAGRSAEATSTPIGTSASSASTTTTARATRMSISRRMPFSSTERNRPSS